MPRILLIDPGEALQDGLRASPFLQRHDVDVAAGDVDALRRLWRRDVAVLVTSPSTQVAEDLALLHEARRIRPAMRSVVLASRAAPESVVAALRARVFALFSQPFAVEEIAAMIDRAIAEAPWHDGIELLSAHPDWLSVRVDSSLITAERILQFISELHSDVPAADREGLLLAYREVLMMAMDHGPGLAPGGTVDVIAVRTERAIVFYVRDPGSGFDAAMPSSTADFGDQGLLAGGDPENACGLLLARLVVDEVMFNEQRNEIVLIKHTR